MINPMDFIARVFGGEEVAYEVGKHMNCGEADCLAVGMALGDRREAAITFLIAHAHGDDDPDDKHHALVDPVAGRRGMDFKQSFLREQAGRHLDGAIAEWAPDNAAGSSMKLEVPGYGEIITYRSEKDGVLVVEIDTPEATEDAGTADGQHLPRLRVYVNDGAVWEHPPYPVGDGCHRPDCNGNADDGCDHEEEAD